MPEQDFSPDNLLGLGTKDSYFPTLSPYNTPSPTKDTFIDIVKKDDGELICFKICTLIFALIIGVIVTYLLFFNNKSSPPPVEEFRTSGFGSTFDTIIDELILND